jgi:hypothetical protein
MIDGPVTQVPARPDFWRLTWLKRALEQLRLYFESTANANSTFPLIALVYPLLT